MRCLYHPRAHHPKKPRMPVSASATSQHLQSLQETGLTADHDGGGGCRQAIEQFIARWQGLQGGRERANYQLFLIELAQALGVEGPAPATPAAGITPSSAP